MSWQNAWRSAVELEGEAVAVLSLPDLVQAKKTQRDKDWPMIRRLLESHYLQNRNTPTPAPARIKFWLHELRTVALLREVAADHPAALNKLSSSRPVLSTLSGSDDAVECVLREEEDTERRRDREYWQPLKAELGQLRHRH
jgi:hypothetical protein